MLIDTEKAADRPQIEALMTAAFGPAPDGAEPVETLLLRALWRDSGYLPALSLVAAEGPGSQAPGSGAPGEGRRILGYSITTTGRLGGRDSLGLGPIAVLPAAQRQGIGAALLAETARRAAAAGYPELCLLGDTAYYQRFGYRPARLFGITAPDPDWGDHFMVLPLAGRTPGTEEFAYAAPFGRL